MVAIEVKSGRQRRLTGLDAFSRKYKPHRAMLVGGDGTPVADFLTSPLDRWFEDP